jgi:hypothetical protein
MQTQTVANIIARAREAADAQTPTPTADFVTDTELGNVVLRGYQRLCDGIINVEGGIDLLAVNTTLTSPYTLPADFYRLAGVDVPDASQTGRWVTLKQFSFANRNAYYNETYPRYRVIGGVIHFSPEDAAPSQLRLWYVPVTTEGTSGPDQTVLSLNGWDEYLVYDAAMYIAVKEERDPSVHAALRDAALQRVVDAVRDLVVGDTMVVADREVYMEDAWDRWL